MIYQLATLDNWIRTEISPEQLKEFTSNSQLKESLQHAADEKERICTYFRDKAIKQEPTLLTVKFIQAHQVGINIIADLIRSYRSKEFRLSEEENLFYLKLAHVVEELIHCVEHHFPEYFDYDQQITVTHAELCKIDLNKQLQLLQPLQQNQELDKVLLRMAIKPLRDFIDDGKSLTYRELAYLKELASSLKSLLDADSNNLTYELHLVLLQLNFNYPRYILHYSYWLDAKLLEIANRTERLDKLSWYIHAIEQIRYKPNFVFIPELPSLKEQLLNSIKTTYQYLLTEYKPVNHTIVEQINTSVSNRPKIKLSISVSALALFLKLLIKARIINNENKSEVFRIIADNFTTMKSEQLSFDSLKGKYNMPRKGSERLLNNILQQIMQNSKRI